MISFNDKYNEEIHQMILKYPKAYGKMLKSKGFQKRCPDRTYLVNYIYSCTQILDNKDFNYSFKTRIYWTVNKIEDWNNSLVCCKICGKPIKNWNIHKLLDGYKNSCCTKCERTIASATNKEVCMKKYGVTNVFASKEIRNRLDAKKDAIYNKRKENALKLHGCKVWNNPQKAMKTKIQRYGNVWHLQKCQETMIERHGAPNLMQVASIHRKQQSASYVMDRIKFDSSWEVYMYIWLRDKKIQFQYHPSSPEFWYEKKDGSRHRYYPDFILTEEGEIWEPKGDNSFDAEGRPIKNGWFDWTEKHEYMKKLGVKFFFKEDIQPFREYVEEKYGQNYIESLIDKVDCQTCKHQRR